MSTESVLKRLVMLRFFTQTFRFRSFMLFTQWTEQTDRESGYLWLWRLRWYAAAALLCGALAVEGILQVRLSWWVIGSVLLLLVATNLAARPGQPFVRRHFKAFTAGWLTLDIMLLTWVLYVAGGAHNPFTMLYLLYVAMAVILLPVSSAWWVVGLTVAAFAVLFESPYMLIARDGRHLCSDMDFHLKGMVLGLGVAGAGVVYFISSLNRALAAKHRELEKLRAQMTEQRKLVELSAVAATVAHEVATPLGTIAVIGRDLAAIDYPGERGEQLREDARLIEEAIERCRRVLDMAGQAYGESVSDVSEPVTAELFFSRLSLYLTAKELSRLQVLDQSEAGGTLQVPLQELVIMVSILVRNAFDASAEDVSVKLVWRRTSAEVIIEIEDEGEGMSEAVLTKATDPFFTTKSASHGIGLGLYLVRHFCERHSGSLELKSESGRGTQVAMRLPSLVGARVDK
jgi:two-component system sensor histidine kinase RegB